MGTSNLNKTELIGEDYRKQYLEYYILNCYRSIVQTSKFQLNFFYYSYLAFIINGLQNENISFREVIKLKNLYKNKRFSLQQSLTVNYFFDLASQQFQLEAKKISTGNSEQLIDIILFDESIQDCTNQLKEALVIKQDILKIIGKDYINLHELEEQLKFISTKRSILINQLLRLHKIHQFSPDLICLSEGFEECLTLDSDLSKLQVNQTNNRFGGSYYLKSYSEDTTAIYISLLQDIGKIIKVSKNFKDVVPLVDSNIEAIGKNIKFLQPPEISTVHDSILLQSLQKQRLSRQINSYPLLIGKDREGWAIAYSLKVQLFMIGNSELGVCGLVKQLQDDNMYVMAMTNENYRIAISDKQFYNGLLQKYFSIQESHQIQLSAVIPMLKHICEKGSQDMQYETIAFQPQNLKEATTQYDVTDQDYLSNLVNKNLFFIRFSFYQIRNELIQITQLQINQLKPLQDTHSKKEAIRNLKLQILQFSDKNHIKANINDVLSSLNLKLEESEDSSKNKKPTTPEREEFSITHSELMELGLKKKDSEQYVKSEQSQLNLSHTNTEEKHNTNIQHHEFLGQIQEETEQNSLYSPEIVSRRLHQRKLMQIPDFTGRDNKLQTQQVELTTNPTIQNIPSINQFSSYQSASQNNLFGQSPQRQSNGQHLDTQIHVQLLSQESHIQNIISSETLMFSPKSSQRKTLINAPETNRSLLLKGEGCILSALETGIDDDHVKINSMRKRVSTQFTNYFDPKQQSGANKNFSTTVKSSQLKLGLTTNPNVAQLNSANQLKVKRPLNMLDDNKEEGSVKSSKSQRSQSKSQIINTIRKKDDSRGLKMVNFLGIACILIIGACNLISFQQQMQNEYLQKINFKFISWTFNMKRSLTLFFGNDYMVQSLLLGHYMFSSKNDLKAFGKTVYGVNAYMYQSYQNLTQALLQGNQDDIYVFREVNDYETQFSLPNIINSTILTNFTSHLTFKIVYFQTIGYYISYLQDTNQYNLLSGAYNYMDINTSLDTIYENNQQYQLEKINNIKQFIIGQLIVISIVTGVFSFLSIPIYMFNIKKKEDILKLFATIPSEKIILMMGAVNKHSEILESLTTNKPKFKKITQRTPMNKTRENEQSLQCDRILMHERDTLSFFSSNQIILRTPIENLKKKSISLTNELNKFNIKLVFGIVLCLGFTLFYPIASYIISTQRIETYQLNIYFLNSFDYLIDNLISLFGYKYAHTLFMLGFKGKYSNLGFYLNTFNDYRKQTQSYLDKLMINFQSYEQYNGYLRSYYDSLLIPLVEDNICLTLNNTNPAYFREISYSYDSCSSCLNGIYLKGLPVVIKQGMSIMDQYYEIAASGNYTQFKTQFILFQQNLHIRDEYYYLIYMLYLNEIIHYFSEDTYDIYYDYTYNLQITLIIVQVVLLFLVALFGWRKFYNGLSSTYFNAKQHLDIIDINYLVDNPYVLSFFKKNA